MACHAGLAVSTTEPGCEARRPSLCMLRNNMLRNWIIRPLLWIFPVSLLSFALDIRVTWQLVVLCVAAEGLGMANGPGNLAVAAIGAMLRRHAASRPVSSRGITPRSNAMPGSDILGDWLVRPLLLAVPLALLAFALDVRVTWRVVLLFLAAAVLDAIIDSLYPRRYANDREPVRD
jgi:hypothetical protein